MVGICAGPDPRDLPMKPRRVHGLSSSGHRCSQLKWDLLDDFARLYQGGILPEKGSSYRQWGAALQAYSAKGGAIYLLATDIVWLSA